MTSILNTIKHMLGIQEDYYEFDNDIIIDINSVLAGLSNMGGLPKFYKIESANDTWSDLFKDIDKEEVEIVKTYIYLKVKILFDPPANATILNAYEKTIDEMEYRLISIFNTAWTEMSYE